MSTTPKFDKFVQKFVNAGVDVQVSAVGAGKVASVVSGTWRGYSIASVNVTGTIENFIPNNKMKTRLGVR